MIVDSTNVELTTEAQLLPSTCCVQYGDCLTHLSNMADNQVSYTITSPPYNVGTVKGKSKYQNTKDNYTQD
jgi:DNA modification methylase